MPSAIPTSTWIGRLVHHRPVLRDPGGGDVAVTVMVCPSCVLTRR
jgi:hypothetical protein